MRLVAMAKWVSPLLVIVLLALAGGALGAESPSNSSPAVALRDYVCESDSSYGWTVRRSTDLGTGSLLELILTSQTWQGIVWKHQLFIYRPAKVAPAASALLLISGGRWDDQLAAPPADGSAPDLPKEFSVLTQLADQLEAPVAMICQVPEQPIFDGKTEDEIISFTFAKFCETGDTRWPLLLPMVKSAVRAMDAIGAAAKQQWNLDVERFLVTGASKRGWTTWLTAAVDSRVTALAPMVINMLNMEPHMKLQLASFGGFSDEIRDYTNRGLPKLLSTPRGTELREIVDPYSYLNALRQPKLIVLGTNDRYWPVDALNLYWDALEGEKYALYVPNNGHRINDYSRVLGSIVALDRAVAGGKPMPKLAWEYADDGDELSLKLSVDVAPAEVLAWTASAGSRDFRDAVWKSQPMDSSERGGRAYRFDLPKPADGCEAVFAEVKFPGEKLPFYLSTGLRVVESAASKDRSQESTGQ